MNPVSEYGYEFDAWLASACMPAVTVRSLLNEYGTSEACHEAVCRNEDRLKELISQRFYQLLYDAGTKGSCWLSPYWLSEANGLPRFPCTS